MKIDTAVPPMTETTPFETLVERYARMSHTFAPRPVDRLLRVLDIVLAAAGLVVTAPLMALCALAVRLSDDQESALGRAGQLGRPGAVGGGQPGAP